MYDPYQGNPYYRPTWPQPAQFQRPTGIVAVNGVEGARAYALPPNSKEALFDANDDVFYLVETDGAGYKTVRRFSFTEMPDPAVTAAASYVTREELGELSRKLDEIAEKVGARG